jgi:hypothetical protein
MTKNKNVKKREEFDEEGMRLLFRDPMFLSAAEERKQRNLIRRMKKPEYERYYGNETK